ncbi:MAG: hypothetical protein IPH93_01120 [Saprospiraceae bacterium]|nr:hypothetical protein [Saprospiraceae bacterium]
MNPALLFVSLLFFPNTSFIDSLSLPHEHWHLLAREKHPLEKPNRKFSFSQKKEYLQDYNFEPMGQNCILKDVNLFFLMEPV